MEYEGRIWRPAISRDTDQALWIKVQAVGPIAAAEAIARGLFSTQHWAAVPCGTPGVYELAVPAKTKNRKPTPTGTFIRIRQAKGGQLTARVLPS